MNHDTRGGAIINTTTHEQDEDHRDAMEVDGAPSMMIDTSRSHDSIVDNEVAPVETNAMVTTTNEAPASSSQSRDLGSAPDTPRSALPGSREPPAFDEDTERPRQRRRVTMQDENDGEIRTVTDTTPAATSGTSAGEDEVAVLVTAPPRLSDLSIHTPRSATPPAATVESAMQGVVPSPPAPAAPRGPSNPQSPRIGTIPLPDVPPPPARNPNDPPDPIMQAARRLTTAPDGNADQLQADLALLAPYIAAQAMAAAFPPGGDRPPGGAPGGGAPNPGNGAPNPPNGQQQPEGQGAANNAGPPPFPFPFGFPFMFGGNTEVPPDPKRAERLASGLKVVEDGLLKRWRAVCGEEGAVCAVCYGELLEEPGIEKEKGKAKEEDENAMEGQADGEDQSAGDEEAHSRALREALKRREEMEKLEREEKELKLETAVLAFPCGHVFHRTCLLPWLSRHTTCPTCRFDIDPKSDTLTLPADDGMPPFLGPNGFNFGDFFTVGPVLRMPRAHAPNLGPRPMPGHNHTHDHDPGHRRERRDSNQPAGGNSRPRPSDDERAGNAGASRSMTDLFDSIFGPLFESVGTPAARRPATTAQAQPNQEPARQEPPAPVATQETSTQEAAAQSTTPPEAPTARAPPSIADLDPPRSRTNPPIATEYRPIDYNRPLAMFGRPSPRRPPQPVTPAWMRPPRPPPATTPATSTAPAPSTSAAGASSAPASTASTSTAPASASSSRPAAPSSSQPTDTSRGLGQIRSIVSNLIPRRLNASARAVSSNASVRSNRSSESAGSSSAAQTGPRPALTPISPRTGIRAILQGPTALLRDLASRRPADPETEDHSRGSVDSTLPRQSLGDDMPGLESDTEDGSTYSEDDAHTSEDDADMPALEPVEPRASRAPAASTSGSQTTSGNNAQPPPPASSSTQASAQSSQGTSNATNADQPPVFGPPRPPTDNNPNTMENIITLRIDLGHADGRDETIIVPLLFNPSGRNNDQNRRDEPRPAAAQPPPPSRQRTPPPQKKWVPPEPIKTFRQVVEEKEREAGWRCDDPACLLGPADDEEPSNEHPIKPMYSIMRSLSPDDDIVRSKIEDGIRVYADGEDVRVKGENPVCAHQLHPECLVTSARVNGWGPDHNSKSDSRVTLRCPMCRLEGTVERQIWDAGVEAEVAGEA